MASEWREHPKLAGRFQPGHPDDVQVIVHDGGPRITPNPPEAVWVRIAGMQGDVFRGEVLNRPSSLQGIRQGSEIKFIVPAGGDPDLPIMVTDKYLGERPAWVIHPCPNCGLSELFDAPSDLIRVTFPNAPPGAVMEMFTAKCPMCDGMLGVELQSSSESQDTGPAGSTSGKRPWWKFWG